ncbi:MAG: iron-sulfur cluster assembly scaffold protein [Anaerolineae bacterium]
MYTERLLDHYRRPRNRGHLEPSDTARDGGQVRTAREYNPLCGDEVIIEALVEAGRVVAVRFHGRGCALCMGSASISTEVVQGRSLDDLASLDQAEYLRELGVSIPPARLKCALLPWVALRHAIFGEEEQDLSIYIGGAL